MNKKKLVLIIAIGALIAAGGGAVWWIQTNAAQPAAAEMPSAVETQPAQQAKPADAQPVSAPLIAPDPKPEPPKPEEHPGCVAYDAGQYAKALPLLQAAAESGNAEAAARLSLCCEFGLGRTVDTAAAAEWAAAAAKGGVSMERLSRPVPTASDAKLDTFKLFAVIADTSRLATAQDLQKNKIQSEFYEERDKEKRGLQLFDVGKTSSPVLYNRTFDTFRGECLLVTDDIIATVKDETTADFWDARSLRYHFSCRGMRTEGGEEFWQYDANTGRLAFRSLSVDGNFYGGWMGCSAFDFRTLETEFQEIDVYDKFGTLGRGEVPSQSGRVFSHSSFRHLDSISHATKQGDNYWELMSPTRDVELLTTLPALRDLASDFRQPLLPLSIEDIDFSTLSVKRQPKKESPAVAENQPERGLESTDIQGLDINKKWLVRHVKDSMYHVEADMNSAETNQTYIYDEKKKILYPTMSESGFAGSPEGVASDCAVGESDMGWYTGTLNCWAIRYHSDWMGDAVWDSVNNRIYDIDRGTEEGETLAQRQAFCAHPLAGIIKVQHYGGCHLLSVWNKLPGSPDRAYWIAAGATGWTLCDVQPSTGECRTLAHGGVTWQTGQAPLWLRDRKWFCIPLNENVWKVYRFDEEKVTMSDPFYVYLHRGNEFAVALEDGRYAGTPGCESFLFAQKDGVKVGMTALAPWRNRPAEVLQALGGSTAEVEVLQHTTRRWLRKMGYDADHMPAEPSGNDYPAVLVERPALRTSEVSISVPINIKAVQTAITNVEVRIDGVKIPQSWSENLYISPGSSVTLKAQLPLVGGQNWVEVAAVDTAGLHSNTERFRVLCEASSPQPKLYVVALGVSQYQDASLNLQYAAKDAGDIAEAFRRYYHGVTEVLLLRDAEVQDAGVLQQVKDFVAQAAPQDRVVMYCAGHGMLDEQLDYYYAPAAFDAEQVAATGIPMESFLDTLETSSARSRLLLLDTCHSGSLGEEGEEKMALAMGNLPAGVRAIQRRGMKIKKAEVALDAQQQKRYIEELFATGTQRRGINVLAGAAGAEYALESGEWKNGVFTASVIEALNGASGADTNYDGQISIAELYEAVADSVQERTNGAQRPSMSMLENHGAQALVQNMGYFVASENWEAVEKMAAEGYQLKESAQGAAVSWLGIAIRNQAPLRTIEALLKAGADANRCMPYNNSSIPLLEYMLKQANQYDYKSKRPYDKNEAIQRIELMLQYGAKNGLDQLMLDFDVCKSAPLVDMLIKHGANVNAVDDMGRTPLMRTTDSAVARILLTHGADVAMVNLEGKTVLDESPQFTELIREICGEKAIQSMTGAIDRVVAARLFLSARDVMPDDLARTCTPSIAILPKGKMTHTQMLRSLASFTKRWPTRVYKVLGVARQDNVIQIQVHYTCKGPETYDDANPPRTTQGYTLMTIHLDEQGKIKAMGEKTSKSASPAFSPGMQQVPYNGPTEFTQY